MQISLNFSADKVEFMANLVLILRGVIGNFVVYTSITRKKCRKELEVRRQVEEGESKVRGG